MNRVAPNAPTSHEQQLKNLRELERLKAEAVAVEDYELAALLRNQITELKASGQAPAQHLKHVHDYVYEDIVPNAPIANY